MTVVYDVTTFTSPSGTSPFTDLGIVINEIITNIKASQTTQTTRPGAVIYIPPGHYDLYTQVNIDISYLQIKGAGHGFLSQETRDWGAGGGPNWYERIPGASHIRVLCSGVTSAFRIYRAPGAGGTDTGRISSVEFRDLCLDGVDIDRPYVPTSGRAPLGISADSNTDSVRIEGCGFTRLRTAIVMHGADGTNITNNFICEIGAGIEMYGGSCTNIQITNNTILPAWAGAAVKVDNGSWPYICDNILDYWGNIQILNSSDATIRGNRIGSWWPHQIYVSNSHDCFIADNHLGHKDNRTDVPGPGLDDTTGIIYVNGDGNLVTNNLISIAITAAHTVPSGATVAAIRVDGGSNNFLTTNRITSGAGAPYNIKIGSGASGTRVLWSAPLAQISDSGSGTQIVATP